MKKLLLILPLALTLGSCAHVQPVINTIVTCSGQTIPAGLVDEVYTDIMTENWSDLAMTAVPALAAGWADVACIYDALKGANPALVGHMEKLKAGHVELRAAVSLRSPEVRQFSYAGESVAAAARRCRRDCGSPESIGSPGGSCSCWHADRTNWRNSRWMAAR